MKRSGRLLVAGCAIETGLSALWISLVSGIRTSELNTSLPADEAIAAIGTTIGGPMGFVGAIVLVASIMMRRKDC